MKILAAGPSLGACAGFWKVWGCQAKPRAFVPPALRRRRSGLTTGRSQTTSTPTHRTTRSRLGEAGRQGDVHASHA
jgi:hypothetical protein